jgi:hypothetical protein
MRPSSCSVPYEYAFLIWVAVNNCIRFRQRNSTHAKILRTAYPVDDSRPPQASTLVPYAAPEIAFAWMALKIRDVTTSGLWLSL